MPQVSNITLLAADLTDSATNEVMSVVDRKEGVTTFRYAGSNPLALASRLTVAVKQPKNTSKYARVVISFVKPETYQSAETNLIEQSLLNRAQIEFQIDKNATLAQITSMTERVLAILKDTDVQTAINQVENFY